MPLSRRGLLHGAAAIVAQLSIPAIIGRAPAPAGDAEAPRERQPTNIPSVQRNLWNVHQPQAREGKSAQDRNTDTRSAIEQTRQHCGVNRSEQDLGSRSRDAEQRRRGKHVNDCGFAHGTRSAATGSLIGSIAAPRDVACGGAVGALGVLLNTSASPAQTRRSWPSPCIARDGNRQCRVLCSCHVGMAQPVDLSHPRCRRPRRPRLFGSCEGV
jgi:hypothetical protein